MAFSCGCRLRSTSVSQKLYTAIEIEYEVSEISSKKTEAREKTGFISHLKNFMEVWFFTNLHDSM